MSGIRLVGACAAALALAAGVAAQGRDWSKVEVTSTRLAESGFMKPDIFLEIVYTSLSKK
jgi:hypothetical protein